MIFALRKGAVTIGAALLVGAFVAAMVPLWMVTAGSGLRSAGWGAVGLMIACCFAVGGGLTLMIFAGTKRGNDDAAPAADGPVMEAGRQED